MGGTDERTPELNSGAVPLSVKLPANRFSFVVEGMLVGGEFKE
jgi:hypothetical protein